MVWLALTGHESVRYSHLWRANDGIFIVLFCFFFHCPLPSVVSYCLLSLQHLSLPLPAMPPAGHRNGSPGNHPGHSDEPACRWALASGMLLAATPAGVCCEPSLATSLRSYRQMFSGRWDTQVGPTGSWQPVSSDFSYLVKLITFLCVCT